ncbi:MAG: hypothetical protein AMXMBFR13_26540 [Phycisphaerae bacterium]
MVPPSIQPPGRPGRKAETLLDTLLEALAARDLWLIDDLPEACTESALRALDGQGHIEAIRTDLHPLHRFSGWFSPSKTSGNEGRWATLLSLWGRQAVRLRVTEAGRAALALRQLAGPAHAKAKPGHRMSREEANVLAREFLEASPNATARELAAALGCSASRAVKLPAWVAVSGERKKGRVPKAEAVSLTDGLLATLSAEQQADDKADSCKRGPRVRRRF